MSDDKGLVTIANEFRDMRVELRELIDEWRMRLVMREQVVFCVREERARADEVKHCADELEALLEVEHD